jgi:hypothetical protein
MSGVFKNIENIDPPPPPETPLTAREWVPPAFGPGGGHTIF